ncbi:carboxypeptidase-like regulatory domain-containing protein [Posidoniimonas corsicana]|nr:carboxypeptidase-like regulatory domain-containing protein [Posidoniimonas corsicana]
MAHAHPFRVLAAVAVSLIVARAALGVDVHGRVVDDHDHPVAGMQVLLWSVPDRANFESSTDWHSAYCQHRKESKDSVLSATKTDDAGRYRFDGVPAQTYLIQANPWGDAFESSAAKPDTAPKLLATMATWVDATDVRQEHQANVRVSAGRRFRIQLVDSDSGKPLDFDQPFAVEYVPQYGEERVAMRRQSAQVSQQGCVELRAPADAVRLRLSPPQPIDPHRTWGGILAPVDIPLESSAESQPTPVRVADAVGWRHQIGSPRQ